MCVSLRAAVPVPEALGLDWPAKNGAAAPSEFTDALAPTFDLVSESVMTTRAATRLVRYSGANTRMRTARVLCACAGHGALCVRYVRGGWTSTRCICMLVCTPAARRMMKERRVSR